MMIQQHPPPPKPLLHIKATSHEDRAAAVAVSIHSMRLVQKSVRRSARF